ncbi:hypothetical protein [Streptomyces subrutilus]
MSVAKRRSADARRAGACAPPDGRAAGASARLSAEPGTAARLAEYAGRV